MARLTVWEGAKSGDRRIGGCLPPISLLNPLLRGSGGGLGWGPHAVVFASKRQRAVRRICHPEQGEGSQPFERRDPSTSSRDDKADSASIRAIRVQILPAKKSARR